MYITEEINKSTNESNVKVNNNICVFIDGDKSCFVSKTAIEKFKKIVKDSQFKIDDLKDYSNRFMKPGFKLICYANSNSEYKFKICDLPTITTPNPIINQKEKVKRYTNNNISKDEIFREYNKLIKLSKMPIPEPKEVLRNPEEYKPILESVLNNDMMTKLGKNHPYVRYFTLLANKIGVKVGKKAVTQEIVPTLVPRQEFKHIILPTRQELKQVTGNNIYDNVDIDTDTEDEEVVNKVVNKVVDEENEEYEAEIEL